MLSKLFTWFYCLDFDEALALLGLFTVVFCFLNSKLGRRKPWKAAVIAALAVWFAVVLAQTIFLRTPDPKYTAIWTPLQSYREVWIEGRNKELLRSDFMNAALFYPAGLLLASSLPEKFKKPLAVLTVLAAATLLSGAIEYAQYRFHLGLAQTDDILHNALGATLGAVLMCVPWHKTISIQS